MRRVVVMLLFLFLGAAGWAIADDPEERPVGGLEFVDEVRIPAADYDSAVRQRFAIDVTLLLEEGQQRVAVGLMDQLTRRASYDRMVVTVP